MCVCVCGTRSQHRNGHNASCSGLRPIHTLPPRRARRHAGYARPEPYAGLRRTGPRVGTGAAPAPMPPCAPARHAAEGTSATQQARHPNQPMQPAVLDLHQALNCQQLRVPIMLPIPGPELRVHRPSLAGDSITQTNETGACLSHHEVWQAACPQSPEVWAKGDAWPIPKNPRARSVPEPRARPLHGPTAGPAPAATQQQGGRRI